MKFGGRSILQSTACLLLAMVMLCAALPAAVAETYPTLVGTWRMFKLESGGKTIDDPEKENTRKLVTFNADGTAIVVISKNTYQATWTEEGDTVHLVYDDGDKADFIREETRLVYHTGSQTQSFLKYRLTDEDVQFIRLGSFTIPFPKGFTGGLEPSHSSDTKKSYYYTNGDGYELICNIIDMSGDGYDYDVAADSESLYEELREKFSQQLSSAKPEFSIVQINGHPALLTEYMDQQGFGTRFSSNLEYARGHEGVEIVVRRTINLMTNDRTISDTNRNFFLGWEINLPAWMGLIRYGAEGDGLETVDSEAKKPAPAPGGTLRYDGLYLCLNDDMSQYCALRFCPDGTMYELFFDAALLNNANALSGMIKTTRQHLTPTAYTVDGTTITHPKNVKIDGVEQVAEEHYTIYEDYLEADFYLGKVTAYNNLYVFLAGTEIPGWED